MSIDQMDKHMSGADAMESEGAFRARSQLETARTFDPTQIVGEDLSRIRSNLNNLTGSYDNLIMQNRILRDNNEELLAELHLTQTKVNDLTLQIKLTDGDLEATPEDPHIQRSTSAQQLKPSSRNKP